MQFREKTTKSHSKHLSLRKGTKRDIYSQYI